MLTYSGMLVKLLSYLATIYHPEWVEFKIRKNVLHEI